MPEEKLALKKEIAELKAEVWFLRTQVANLTIMLKREMGIPQTPFPSKSKKGKVSN
jgi:hypothetical protein